MCVTPRAVSGRWSHTSDCRHVTLVQGVGGGHPGSCGLGAWVQGLGGGVTLGIIDMLLQVYDLGEVHPGDCGWATLGAGTGRKCHTGHCGHVTPGT